MKKEHRTETLKFKGMVCTSCEKIITRQALQVQGVKGAKADFVKGECEVTYDAAKTSPKEIIAAIEAKGYTCADGAAPSATFTEIASVLAILAVLIGAYVLVEPKVESYMPSLTKDVSLPLIFIIGLFTGFHCIAMCGGFVIGYSAKNAAAGRTGNLQHIEYGLAKTLSYAFFGAVFGLIGSYVTFTPMLRGAAAVLAGLFLILFGLNMLGILTSLGWVRFRMPSAVDGWMAKRMGGDASPAMIGLMNGLMIACGPLQAIYLLAAASGSPYYGALYLAAFGLGTLPLLLGFGALASSLSLKMTKRILKYSGVVVLLLGLIMVNRGIALSGTGYDVNSITASAVGVNAASDFSAAAVDADGYQTIRMNVTAYGWQPDTFVLRKGVPVKWVIDGQQITSCNSAIQVPKYGLKFDIKKGLQTIQFTPTESGTVPWSCWMGMLHGVFVVKSDIDTGNPVQVQKALDTAPTTPKGMGSCNMGGGGGCGCGMM